MKVCIIGTGYVGLTTGLCLAYVGHEVCCVDIDREKVRRLRNGIPAIHEPGLREMLGAVAGRVRFTDDLSAGLNSAQVVFIAVGTPPLADGNPDLRFVREAGEQIGKHLNGDFTVVVNKSTVPVGSGNWVEAIVRDSYQAQRGQRAEGAFTVASNPEFLREGSAIHDSLYPDRIVIGVDDARGMHVLEDLYRPITEQSFPPPAFAPRPEGFGAVPIVTADLASAELIKYAANSFLSVKISFANEVAILAERVGANVNKVMLGIGLDGRIGRRFLQAGLGWGRSCFGKDTAALVATPREYGACMRIVRAARDVNYSQRALGVEKLLGPLKILKGKTIRILGLAFKPTPTIYVTRQDSISHSACWTAVPKFVFTIPLLSRTRGLRPAPGSCSVRLPPRYSRMPMPCCSPLSGKSTPICPGKIWQRRCDAASSSTDEMLSIEKRFTNMVSTTSEWGYRCEY